MLCFLLFVVGDAVGPQRQKQLSLILLDANRTFDRDNRLWADRSRAVEPDASKVKVVVGGQEKLATLAVDASLENALATRDLPQDDESETVDISGVQDA
jgi:hypothetical protein